MASIRARREALLRDPRIQQFLIANVQATGKKLGSGAYGSVEELVIDGVLCAGKRIHEALLEEGNAHVPSLVRKYVEECQLLSNMRHPHIVQFVGLCFFPDSSLPLLIMELLLTSLDDLLENTPDIPLALKRSMLADVAKGLTYLHNHNPPIIHRDLSAKNVLLNSAMVAKISDLGNSRIVTVDPLQLAKTLTRVPGTIVYMPPEAFERTSPYGPKLDVFSFGVLALFTLTQEFPGDLRPPNYPDPTNMDRLLARTEVERRDDYIDTLHAQLGEKHPLVQLVKWCLHNIPARRPSADILIQQLEGVQIPDPYQHLMKVETMKLLRLKDDLLQQLQLDKDQMVMELQAQIQHKDTENRAVQFSKDQMAAEIQHKDTEIRALQEHIRQKDVLLIQKDNVLRQKDALLHQNDALLHQNDALLHQKDEQLALLMSQQTAQSPSKPKEPTVVQEVIQESEAGAPPSALQQPQAPEMSEAKDAPDHTEELSVADQIMLSARVVRQNFAFLYQHLAIANILPVVVGKGIITEAKRKEVDTYTQTYARNIVIMGALFLNECPPDGLVRLTDVLAMTPGQELVARKLQDDYNQMSRRVPSPGVLPGPPLTTPIPSDFSELSQLFQQALHSIMSAFDDIPNIIGVVKEILSSLVLPLGDGKVASLVEAASYQHAQTHREVFRLMSPYWNCLSTDLLQLLTEASGCNLAAMKLSEFVQARYSKGHSVLCCSQDSSKPQGDDVDASISPGHRSVHTGPLAALQSLHPAVFVRLPEHKAVASRNTIRITAEVNKPLLSLSDYEALAAAVSAVFELPRQALVFAGCSVNPIVVCWLVSADVLPYIKPTDVGLSAYRLLAEHNISGIAVGNVISYKCPSIKEVELWEACRYGLIERVRDLLHTVHIDTADLNGFTPLHRACQNGHTAVVSLLLEHGADLHVTNNEGFTPLHSACQNGHTAVVSLLLEHGADLHLKTNKAYGATPLMLACIDGHITVVQLLVEAKVNVNQLSRTKQKTALMIAAENGHLETIKKLIQNGANIHMKDENGLTPLHWACQEGHNAVMSVLLEHAADPHLTTNYESGLTPLMLACLNGHTTVVQLLIQAKVNVNQLSRTQRRTALMMAAENGHLETVNKLIQNGANIHMKNEEDGLTTLHLACQNGHSAVVSVLLEHAADPHLTTNNGLTPLHWACQKGHPAVVSVLLEYGADPHLTTNNGLTPLHWACQKGHPAVVSVLLEYGADPHLTTNYERGLTPLMLACQSGHITVVQQLIEAKVNVNQLSRTQQKTALMIAAEKGHLEIIKKLIQNGANIHMKDENGFTPLHMACQKGHPAVVSVLLEYAADPHLTNKYESGPTPLMLACLKGHTTVVQLLIEAKVNMNQLSRTQQRTALMLAAQKGHLETVNKLIQNGANIHMKQENGYTPLHWACQNGHSAVVSVLLEYAADPNLTTNYGSGLTPLMLACLDEHTTVVQLLIEAKVNVNQLSRRRKITALMSAAHEGHLEILNKLIQNGANIHMKNEEGETALDLARQKGYTEICQVLRSHQ